MRVVVLGGGAIGASAAFRLAERGAEVVVVECHAVAGAASGKSGGFLALDWCDGTPVEHLARRSFALHAEFADIWGGRDWGYRRMTTFSGTVGGSTRHRPQATTPDWVGTDVAIGQRIGTPSSTAQVHPARFTAATMRAAETHGAILHMGRATGLLRRGERVCGVQLEDGTLSADAVVIAMGPWSALASEWLELPPVYGLKGHSLVFETGTQLPAEALFLDYSDPAGGTLSPEIFPRADGTTYVCGISSETPVPVDPALIAPDRGALERLAALCARVSPVLASAPVVASGACYRPVTDDGLPLIGPVGGADGVFVATGHSVWGILNAPATGETVAELVLDGTACTIDVSPFNPARFGRLSRDRVAISRRVGR
ncbi:MAG: NAD(P)/FAD-dependent oxidoreductase [Janthinobacterium lividum]